MSSPGGRKRGRGIDKGAGRVEPRHWGHEALDEALGTFRILCRTNCCTRPGRHDGLPPYPGQLAAPAAELGVSHQDNMSATGEDDWGEVWDARADALAHVLGQGHDNVFHAPHPFALGGNADVMAFYHHLKGVVYVTAELTGKPTACYAD